MSLHIHDHMVFRFTCTSHCLSTLTSGKVYLIVPVIKMLSDSDLQQVDFYMYSSFLIQ